MCRKCSSAKVPEVPECHSPLRVSPQCPGTLKKSKCPSALQVPWIFECALNVFKWTLCAQRSNQMWLNKILRTNKCICKRTKMLEETFTILLWRRIRALIWKAFEIGYINLISVKIEFSFLYGHQFKELWVGINDLHITIEQKTFLWNAF